MKIAISVSGQTRGFNNISEDWHRGLDLLLQDHEYTLFGHTWDNCELPNDKSKFESLSVTSNNDIWEWASQDMFNRVPYNTSLEFNDEWINCKQKDIGTINFFKKIAIGGWAQIWSFNKTLDDIKFSYKDYDVFFRWRWDSVVSSKQRDIDIFREVLPNWVNDKDIWDNYNACNILTYTPGNLTRRTMQDTHFLLKHDMIENLTKYNFLDVLQATTENIRKYHSHNITAHELWYEYLSGQGANIGCGYPGIRASTEYINPVFEKENKKWGI